MVKQNEIQNEARLKPICLIRAPCNLGLRPLRPGHEPGTWRAPQALTDAGLVEAIEPAEIIDMEQPAYHAEAEPGTLLRNGNSLRHFNLELADQVEQAAERGEFPMVVGGDCAVLLGALAGRARQGPLSLIHIDGHSDFRHPGNYDAATTLSAVAGMDLALATGRGDPLMTTWPGVPVPLVPDEQVVQIGEREGRSPGLRLGRRQRHRLQPHRRVQGARDRRRRCRRKRARHGRPAGLAVLRPFRRRRARPDHHAGSRFARQSGHRAGSAAASSSPA